MPFTCTNTHTRTHSNPEEHHYESSVISWLSVLAIFLGGAGLSPSPCSCSLFFAAFFDTEDKKKKGQSNHLLFTISLESSWWWLCLEKQTHLFVPLLMEVTQKDVGFLCHNDCRNITTSLPWNHQNAPLSPEEPHSHMPLRSACILWDWSYDVLTSADVAAE